MAELMMKNEELQDLEIAVEELMIGFVIVVEELMMKNEELQDLEIVVEESMMKNDDVKDSEFDGDRDSQFLPRR